MQQDSDGLSQRQRTLAVVMERILPAGIGGDVGGAGAREAGVVEFAVQALETPRWRPWRGLIDQGLELIASWARAAHDRELDELSEAQQDAVLERLASAEERPARVLLQRLVVLALEGFLSDPRHGGNRDGVGWRAVGLRPADCTRSALDTPEPSTETESAGGSD